MRACMNEVTKARAPCSVPGSGAVASSGAATVGGSVCGWSGGAWEEAEGRGAGFVSAGGAGDSRTQDEARLTSRTAVPRPLSTAPSVRRGLLFRDRRGLELLRLLNGHA